MMSLRRGAQGGIAHRRLGRTRRCAMCLATIVSIPSATNCGAGEFIPLGPQVFNVLAYLVAHRDRVVSRDELFARLWPDQFVTDDALGRCIRAARRALEDRLRRHGISRRPVGVAIASSHRCRSSPMDLLMTGRRRQCSRRASFSHFLWLAVRDRHRRSLAYGVRRARSPL